MKADEFKAEAMKRVGGSGKYLFNLYGTKTHWCMMQVYYLMHEVAGISEFPKTFSCSGFKSTSFARPRINHDYSTAEIGDIILFEINGNRADGPDHVGVVVENTGSSIKLLEGNTAGTSDLYYDTSTTNVYEYSYDAGCFDCIIDMSDFFSGGSSEPKAEEPIQEQTFTLNLRILKKGMKGNDVKALQRMLFMDGYDVGASCDDGDYGSCTERAVIHYQTDHNLQKDGVAGKETFTALLKP